MELSRQYRLGDGPGDRLGGSGLGDGPGDGLGGSGLGVRGDCWSGDSIHCFRSKISMIRQSGMLSTFF